MNKKEIAEIKKQFNPDRCAITRITGCYVNAEKEKLMEMKEAFLSLSDEEMFKYFDIFKLAYLLGAFNKEQIDRQKACEFIKNAFDKSVLIYSMVHINLKQIKPLYYNKELADFLMTSDNLKKIMELERTNDKYQELFSRIYDSFYQIQK